MRMHSKLIVALALVAMTIAGCTTSTGPKQQVGTVLGAVGGGLLGSMVGSGTGQLVAVGVGTFLGAMLGNEIGASLDRADRAALYQTSQQSLEYNRDGQKSTWHNPNTGNYGYVVPTRTYQTNTGRYCREYQTTVVIGGREQDAYGTACRQEDGSWQIQQS